ncbi:MAG: CHAD domain-containing protein [bacterium]
MPAAPAEPERIDPVLAAYAARAVLERLEMVMKEAAGAKAGGDIEFVHRMRVASRRLRTALRVFADALPSRRGRRWQAAVRRVTRALGSARDTDVQIEFVGSRLAELKRRGAGYGLRRLLLRLRQKRAALQDRVVRRVEEFEHSGVAEEIAATLTPSPAEPAHSPGLDRLCRRLVGEHLAEFLAFEPFVERPRCVRELHEMRIAAKHLRYTLELFRPLTGRRLERQLAAAKEVQAMLGDIHDFDVWREFLPGFVAKEKARTVRFFGSARGCERLERGLRAFERRVRGLRRARYLEFREYWQAARAAGTWERLARFAAAGPKPS